MSTRTCPRCETALQERRSGGHDVDVCRQCGGVFLDQGEFDDLVAERFEGKRLESMFELVGGPVSDPLSCSDCGGEMLRVEYDEVELDRCPDCGGMWVDGHERRDFARQAEEIERNEPDVDELVVCAGCGKGEYRRLCIKRMDQYWCEACVIAGNHPGPEAQLVGMKEKRMDAFRSYASAKADQAARKERAARRREATKKRHRYHRHSVDDGWFLEDLVETTARKIRDLFNRNDRS